MFETVMAEPIPWRERAVVWTPWRYGRCECGREDWLRYHWEAHDYACLACWLGMPASVRTTPYHGFEDDARLRWLWDQVRGGRL
jgi:hypothetical protein